MSMLPSWLPSWATSWLLRDPSRRCLSATDLADSVLPYATTRCAPLATAQLAGSSTSSFLWGSEVDVAVLAAAVATLHAASVLISPRLALFRSLEHSKRADWHGRVVGSVYASLIVAVALAELIYPGADLLADSTFGASARSSFACTLTAAYFVWDTIFCAVTGQGVALVLHGLIAFVVFVCTLQPFQQHASMVFLLQEASTPLLNLRQQLLACDLAHSRIFAVANIGFAVTFLVVRWLVMFPFTLLWYAENWRLLHAVSRDPRLREWVVYGSVMGNVVMVCLNVWWGLQILRGVAKLLRGERRGAKPDPDDETRVALTVGEDAAGDPAHNL